VRRGKGFAYLDVDGRAVDADTRERVKALVIPPAWQDVWISPHPNGHIQAVGTDDAGRRQYLYHEAWHEERGRAKHDRVMVLARKLPAARKQVVAARMRRGPHEPVPRSNSPGIPSTRGPPLPPQCHSEYRPRTGRRWS